MTQGAGFDAIEIYPDRVLPRSIAERWVCRAALRLHSGQCAVGVRLDRRRRIARDLPRHATAQRRRTAGPA